MAIDRDLVKANRIDTKPFEKHRVLFASNFTSELIGGPGLDAIGKIDPYRSAIRHLLTSIPQVKFDGLWVHHDVCHFVASFPIIDPNPKLKQPHQVLSMVFLKISIADPLFWDYPDGRAFLTDLIEDIRIRRNLEIETGKSFFCYEVQPPITDLGY